MVYLTEDKSYYASQTQKEVLLHLITHPTIEEFFFLTGGTALSVFYLHHRLSNDLDFFTLNSLDLAEIDFWIKRMWPQNSTKINPTMTVKSFTTIYSIKKMVELQYIV